MVKRAEPFTTHAIVASLEEFNSIVVADLSKRPVDSIKMIVEDDGHAVGDWLNIRYYEDDCLKWCAARIIIEVQRDFKGLREDECLITIA